MYRPNFCVECGAQIERAHWRWWTSRRFCPGCARRFRRGRIVQLLSACLLLFGFGFSMGRALRPVPPPLVVAGGALPTPAPLVSVAAAHPAQATNATNAQPAPAYGLDGTNNERP